ncbi:MAG: tetratricopeptide repeat protein [Gammaproteobacteria bacterium]|nr:tetratricopeptide repeat protein [Gammaproteobacteria bacterium]MDH3447406.1 tetratricopeptide repeat protein [Gammaproteobacteria bacterium]
MTRRFIALMLCLLLPQSSLAAVSIAELRQQISAQQFAAAVQTGEQLLTANTAHAEARFLTAYAYQMTEQKDRAIELYQGLIDDNPQLPEPRNNLAMIYLAQGDYDHASQLLVEAIHTHPSYATAYDNLSQIYKGIASEAYRRAVSESTEPSKYMHSIQLTAITGLDTTAAEPIAQAGASEPTAVTFANQETLLLEQVKRWAQAWSSKELEAYIDFYAAEFRARFKTHSQWVANRRERILRPGEISVEVSDIQIKWRSENRAIIDFRQAFDSPGYSDRVVKRLVFSRVGPQWKITEERVLSVL